MSVNTQSLAFRLRSLIVYAKWQMTEGADYHPTLRSAVAAAEEALAGGRDAATAILEEIGAERRRQIEAEGWTPQHDDAHDKCELARAAACYVLAPSPVRVEREWVNSDTPKGWPWHWSWWKPGFYRRNLIKAGALIVAEIERWDRLNGLTPPAPADRSEGGR